MHPILTLAAVSAASSSKSSSGSSSLFFLLVIVLLAVFMFMRPGRKRARQQQAQMRTQVVPGAEVRTNAGLYATVSAVSDDYVTLEVAPGILSRYDPRAVVAVVTPAPNATGYGEPAATGADLAPEGESGVVATTTSEEPAETHQTT